MSLIHRYKNNGYNIVLDINSGCIHLVDEVTYDVLPLLEEGDSRETIVRKLEDTYKKEDIETSVTECEKLVEEGMLFTKDIYEKAIEEFSDHRQTVVKALCLHIAHDCNLACRYCFAEEGEYHGRRALMSFEVGKKALVSGLCEFLELRHDQVIASCSLAEGTHKVVNLFTSVHAQYDIGHFFITEFHNLVV